ncbi:MAG: hypothetical protein KJ820_05850 [Bacteroidetes bacterium]|nr:hypothetical protein [Bacteroidota bacterium]
MKTYHIYHHPPKTAFASHKQLVVATPLAVVNHPFQNPIIHIIKAPT